MQNWSREAEIGFLCCSGSISITVILHVINALQPKTKQLFILQSANYVYWNVIYFKRADHLTSIYSNITCFLLSFIENLSSQ